MKITANLTIIHVNHQSNSKTFFNRKSIKSSSHITKINSRRWRERSPESAYNRYADNLRDFDKLI